MVKAKQRPMVIVLQLCVKPINWNSFGNGEFLALSYVIKILRLRTPVKQRLPMRICTLSFILFLYSSAHLFLTLPYSFVFFLCTPFVMLVSVAGHGS